MLQNTINVENIYTYFFLKQVPPPIFHGELTKRRDLFTIGVGSSVVQLPFLRTPELLEGEVKHLSHNPLLRPGDPITVILHKGGKTRETR